MLALAGCERSGTAPSDAFVFVSAVDAPGTAVVGANLTVSISGSVGSNGCYRIREVRRDVSPSRVTMRLVGERGSEGAVCTTAPAQFRTVEQLTMPNADSLVVAVVGADTVIRVVRRAL